MLRSSSHLALLGLLLLTLLAAPSVLTAQSADPPENEAKEPAPTTEAKTSLPPALRYRDLERKTRTQELAARSTARLRDPQYSMHFDPEAEEGEGAFRFRLGFQVVKEGDLVFCMPAWRPGSYQIIDYGRFVEDFEASHEGPYEVEKEGKNLWILEGLTKGKLVLDYMLPANRYKLRHRSRKAGPCYRFHAPGLWMHELRHKDLEVHVSIRLPREWHVATGLKREGTRTTKGSFSFSGFKATDYDVLIDCPLMLGVFERFDFRLEGKRYEIALYNADHDETDRQEFTDRIRRICAHFQTMFGGVPFDRYAFLFAVGFGGGGLEHLNSTTITIGSLKGSQPAKKSWTDSVISHEFFHLWNVKRLRPEGLGPFDYTGPNRTTALWFSEGVTSYFGEKALAQVGLIDAETYWTHIARSYGRLRGNPARARMSIAETSWTVWDGPYMRRPGTVSYYLKGECLGLLLDILIRHESQNRGSLDEVIRRLYEQCSKSGKGFAEDDLRRVCTEIAGSSLSTFFDRYVYGTEDLPLGEVLPKGGLEVQIDPVGKSKHRVRIKIEEDESAKGLPLEIRKALLAPLRRR